MVGRGEAPEATFAEGKVIGVIWLVVALVTWPVVALAAGLVLGRGISVCESRVPRLTPRIWSTRELPADFVTPRRHDRESTPI